jgi:hypothetical protein
MVWSFSFSLLPDETIIDDSTKQSQNAMIKPAYSIFLTNKRTIFRFDSLGSSLTQSFSYHEIISAEPCTKLFVKYLNVKTAQKEYLLHVADAEYWAKKILDIKETVKELPETPKGLGRQLSPELKKRELLDMLTVLRKNSLLSDKEFDEKIRLLDSLPLK